VRNLEERGFIQGYHARLDHKLLGVSVLAYAMVGLSSQAEADLQAFIETIEAMPEVVECHMLSGEVDFILKCQTPDLESFQNFIIDVLTAVPNVDSVKTSLTIKQCKSLPGIDLASAQEAQTAG
jgi:DNA-binding Lrp family transcriptional regulator